MKNKNIKMILTFVLMLASILGIVGTVYFAKTQTTSMPNLNNNSNFTPPSRDNDSTTNSNSSTDSSNSNTTDNSITNSTDNSSTDSNQTTNTPPSMPNGNMGPGMGKGNFGDMRDFKNGNNLNVLETGIIAICSLLFIFSLTYLIKSKVFKMENKEIFPNKDKLIIYLLINIVSGILLTTGIVCTTNSLLLNSNSNKQDFNINNNSNSNSNNTTTNNSTTTS